MDKQNIVSGDLKYRILNPNKSVEVVGANSNDLISIIIPMYIDIEGVDYPVVSIGNYAFSKYSNIISVQIPMTILKIGNSAFYECKNLKSILMPDSVCTIGDNTFNGCSSLETIQFSDNIKSLYGWTFSRCESLKHLILPPKLSYLGSQIFVSCKSLSTITFKSLIPPQRAENLPPFEVDKSIQIFIPKGATKLYKSDTYWGTFDNYSEKDYSEIGVELGEEVKTERKEGILFITGIPMGIEMSIKLLDSDVHIQMGITKRTHHSTGLGVNEDCVLILDGKLRYIPKEEI
jgi:hypothetical protein